MKKILSLFALTGFIHSADAQVQYNWHHHVADTAQNGVVAIDSGDSNFVYVCANSITGVDIDRGPAVHTATAPAYVAVFNTAGAYVRSWCLSIWLLDMCVASNGDVLLAGQFAGTTDFDPSAGTYNLTSPNTYSTFLARYTKNGQLLWVQNFGAQANGEIILFSVDENAGMIGVGGYFINYLNAPVDLDPGPGTANFTSYNNYSGFVVRFNPNGSVAWVQALTGGGVNAVSVNASGELAFTGSVRGQVDFDPGPATAPYTSSSASEDFYVAHYNSMGDYVWHYAVASSNGSGQGLEVDLNNGGEILLTGKGSGALDLDPGSSTLVVNASGYFTAKYSPAGTVDWGVDNGLDFDTDVIGNVYVSGTNGMSCISPGGTVYWTTPVGYTAAANGQSTAIAITPANQIYLAWMGHTQEDVDPGAGTVTVPQVTQYVLVSLNNLVAGTEEYVRTSLSLYPDPASDVLTVERDDLADVSYFIFNSAGAQVASGQLSSSRTEINVGEFANGVYFFRRADDGHVERFIVSH